MRTQTNYQDIQSRSLRRLYQFGLEDYEIEYLMSMKHKNDLSRHWKRR